MSTPRYIDSSEPEDLHDLAAHLHGGIPNRDINALGTYWHVFPGLRDLLFSPNGREGYSDARVGAEEARGVVPEFDKRRTVLSVSATEEIRQTLFSELPVSTGGKSEVSVPAPFLLWLENRRQRLRNPAGRWGLHRRCPWNLLGAGCEPAFDASAHVGIGLLQRSPKGSAEKVRRCRTNSLTPVLRAVSARPARPEAANEYETHP